MKYKSALLALSLSVLCGCATYDPALQAHNEADGRAFQAAYQKCQKLKGKPYSACIKKYYHPVPYQAPQYVQRPVYVPYPFYQQPYVQQPLPAWRPTQTYHAPRSVHCTSIPLGGGYQSTNCQEY